MVNQEEVEKSLRYDFIECLKNSNMGDIDSAVEELITILKKDYILLHSNPLYCKDCVSCNTNYTDFGFSYCVYYQKRINSMGLANGCQHYLNGELEAKKSISVLHKELTKEWVQDV